MQLHFINKVGSKKVCHQSASSSIGENDQSLLRIILSVLLVLQLALAVPNDAGLLLYGPKPDIILVI